MLYATARTRLTDRITGACTTARKHHKGGIIIAEPATVGAVASWIKLADEAYSLAKKVAGDYGRSVVIEVNNLTDETFRTEWDGDGHSSGKFIKPPPLEVPARSTVIFLSGNTGLTGAVGNIRLVSRDVWLGMSWHNAAVGSNKFRSSENGPRGGEFATRATAGGGEKAAAFQYIIYYRDPKRFNQIAQQLQKPLGLPWSEKTNHRGPGTARTSSPAARPATRYSTSHGSAPRATSN